MTIYSSPQFKEYLVSHLSHSLISCCLLISVLVGVFSVCLSWHLGQKTINSYDRDPGYKFEGTLFMVPLLNIAVGNNIDITKNITDEKASIKFFYLIYSSEMQDKIFSRAQIQDASEVAGKLKIRSANIDVAGQDTQIKQLICFFKNEKFSFNYGPTGYRLENSLLQDDTVDVLNTKHKLAIERMIQDIVFYLTSKK